MRRDHRCGGDEGDDCGGGVPAAAPPRGAVLSDVADRAHLPVPHLHVTRRLVDLSHTIEHGMVTYPGLPAPVISDWLSRDAAGAALVGIDSLNIDDATDGTRPVHTILLGAGTPIVEHLCNLGALPDGGFRFFAVPAKMKGMGSFPVRAFARVDA